MPESASSPPVDDELMYSSPPPPHNLRWLSQRVLDLLGRLLVGVLICAMAIGLIILVAQIMYLLDFPPRIPPPPFH